jgi:hypothetical protein
MTSRRPIMFRTMRVGLLFASFLVAGSRVAFAQPTPTAEPTPAVPRIYSTGIPDFTSLEDRNGPVLIGNALLDGPRNNIGWFATAEAGLLNANVNNGLRSSVTVNGATNQVSLPSAGLNWTVGPRLEAGYRFGEGIGEFLITYRMILTTGADTLQNADPLGNAGQLHSSLNMHIIDLDYASQEFALHPNIDMKWRVGVRMASIFFESQNTTPALQQRIADSFFGAGPHIALDLWRPIAHSRVAAYVRADAASVLGRTNQIFEETVGPASGATAQNQFVPLVSLMAQAGFAWTPTDRCRLTVGYTYEHWWDVGFAGQISQPPAFSRADITIQGIFIRGEWRY